MHLVILLLAILTFFLFLTLSVRHDPEKRKLMILFVLIDLWVGSMFLYLLVSAVLDYN